MSSISRIVVGKTFRRSFIRTWREHCKKMFESHLSTGATEKLPRWQKLNAKTVACSYDMEGHAQKCVESSCELANKNYTSSRRRSSIVKMEDAPRSANISVKQ